MDRSRNKVTDKKQPVCVFEGFMDFLSFLSMKEEVTSACLVLNSVSNVARERSAPKGGGSLSRILF